MDMQCKDAPLDVQVVGSTVVLCGEVDISTAPMMEEALFHCIDQGYQNLVVNFERVTYFDSSGIQALLRARSAASEDGRLIQLTGLSQHTDRILRLVGIERFFLIDDVKLGTV